MRIDAAPDPDWYLDHVLAVTEPGLTYVGPARARQGDWLAAVHAAGAHLPAGALRDAFDLAGKQGVVLRREDALATGLGPGRLRSLVRRELWSSPRYGVLSPLPPSPVTASGRKQIDAVRPHGLAVQVRASAAALVRPGIVVSHESAAAMHGLPLIADIERPTLSSVSVAKAAGRSDALVRCVGLRDDEITDWFGASVTTVPRTVVDVARCSGVAAGLVVADAALHDSLTTIAELTAARESGRYRPGIRNAERVLSLADGRAESPLESLVRLCLVDGGLPVPEPQQWIETHRGRFRVDLLYRGQRVVVEADGELKYRGEDDALVREKRRHEALVRAGFTVVRVSWAEVRKESADVVDRVRRALAG